jgi:hypothetical protein
MKKATLEKEIFIDKVNNGKIISGYLTINSSETIAFDNIKGVVFLEARGRMSSYKKEIFSLEIKQNTILTKNKSYRIPLTFDSSNFEINSYLGKNVSFSYILEIHIDVNRDDIEKLERNLFSKVKSFVTSNYTIKTSEYFEIENLNLKYQVAETKTDFTMQPNLIVSIIAFLILGSSCAYIIPEFSIWYTILGIASVVLLIHLMTKYIKNTLGTISMETLKDENSFVCKILKTREFNLMNPYIYYEIIEKVMDNRGTSSSTYTETLYTSEKLKLSDFKSSPSLKFLFPKRNGLQSFECSDASIFWQMKLSGKYMGLTLNYKCIFKVERQ